MYNIRKKLCILAALLFALSAIVPKILPENKVNQTINSQAASPKIKTLTETFKEKDERFVAHRGYSNYAPENSIPAFELAGERGFWGIETDISQTNDGQLVCMHDEEIDRTTNGTGKVSDYSLDELMSFRIDTGKNINKNTDLHIPSFAEFLDICRKYNCVAVVEIKYISDYDLLLDMIKNSGLETKCIITGELDDMKEIRSRNNIIPVMTIGYTPAPYTDNLKYITEIPYNRGILYNYPQVDKAAVEELHSQGIYCGVWSIDDTDIAEKYFDYGADFIVTNEIPAKLKTQ